MDIEGNVYKMKEIYDVLLSLIESTDDYESYFQKLIEI